MTTNVGASADPAPDDDGLLRRQASDFPRHGTSSRRRCSEEAKRVFKPEFLNRINDLLLCSVCSGRPLKIVDTETGGGEASGCAEHPPEFSPSESKTLLIGSLWRIMRLLRWAVEHYLMTRSPRLCPRSRKANPSRRGPACSLELRAKSPTAEKVA